MAWTETPAQSAPPGLNAPGSACGPATFPGLTAQRARAQRSLSRLVRPDPSTADALARTALRAAVIAELSRIVGAVLGEKAGDASLHADGQDRLDVGLPSIEDLRCDEATLGRDRIVWTMTLAGYSAAEIADVIAGHLTRADLDAAQRLLMAGHPRPAVAEFLDARWREVPAPFPGRESDQTPFGALPLPPALEARLVSLAFEHGIDPALVRAVVAAESGGDPRAVSPAGAIGLMQLMPATAAALGVDPWDPLDNLRGGIAYLAGLLRSYPSPTLALVAYNSGPQQADRVLAGRAVPYRDTRRYLDTIGRTYPLR